MCTCLCTSVTAYRAQASVLQHGGSDGEPAELIGPLKNLCHLRITEIFFRPLLARGTIRTHDLHSICRDLDRCIAGEHLGHGAQHHLRWFRSCGLVGEQACCLNLRRHVGEHMLHHLVLYNRATALDTEEAMLTRQLKSATGDPYG